MFLVAGVKEDAEEKFKRKGRENLVNQERSTLFGKDTARDSVYGRRHVWGM